MSEELKPCPFCGGEAKYEAITDQMGHLVLTAWRVKCSRCFCGPLPNNYEGDKANAAKRWNTRTAVTDEQFAYAVHDGDLWVRVRSEES